MICDWLYQNALAIFISAIVSLLISKYYYDKSNRNALIMSIIYPILQVLNDKYSAENYDKLKTISFDYLTKYLNKNERIKLISLIEQYKKICNKTIKDINLECVINYYINKLENEGVYVKPCYELDEEGNIVANNYPPDFWQLERSVKEVIEG